MFLQMCNTDLPALNAPMSASYFHSTHNCYSRPYRYMCTAGPWWCIFEKDFCLFPWTRSSTFGYTVQEVPLSKATPGVAGHVHIMKLCTAQQRPYTQELQSFQGLSYQERLIEKSWETALYWIKILYQVYWVRLDLGFAFCRRVLKEFFQTERVCVCSAALL